MKKLKKGDYVIIKAAFKYYAHGKKRHIAKVVRVRPTGVTVTFTTDGSLRDYPTGWMRKLTEVECLAFLLTGEGVK